MLLADIEKHHLENTRASQYHYKPAFKFVTPYTRDVMGDNPTNKDVAWQTAEEKAKAEQAKREEAIGKKREEAIGKGYKWSVHDVIDDDVEVCNLETDTCETVSRSYFDGIPIVGALYKKITGLLFRKGGKRTKKRRRTKKRKN